MNPDNEPKALTEQKRGCLSVNVNISLWQVAVPLLLVWFMVAFKEELARKISDVNEIKQGEMSMVFRDVAQWPARARAAPKPGEPTMALDEMIEIYAKNGHPMSSEPGKLILAMLQENSIFTKTQLEKMFADPETMRTLSGLYVSVLERPIDRPLDPMAIAQWGPIFFKYGVSEGTIRGITSALKVSAEYQKIHAPRK